MRRLATCLLVAASLLPAPARSAPKVPSSWSVPVALPGSPVTAGKDVGWIRDTNQDFIDDEITARFDPGDTVDIMVALNTPGPAGGPDWLAHVGTLRYVGRHLAMALIDDVPVSALAAIAARPDVAMVEWQSPVYPVMDVATRSINARTACVDADPVNAGPCGAGINVAVVDSGVANGAGTVFAGRFVAGFDPENPTLADPAADTVLDHGTAVAAVLMGAPVAGLNCRPFVEPPPFTRDCRGVAPGAGLVDVKACRIAGRAPQELIDPGPCKQLIPALEWLIDNVKVHDVRVVNVSLATCTDDDGNGILAQYLDALVAEGAVVVAALGNAAGPCALPGGGRHVPSPGSASLAITVGHRNDVSTATANDDDMGGLSLVGPRKDWADSVARGLTPDPQALKPDVVAPSDWLWLPVPFGVDGNGAPNREATGSSLAAPQVAGAAALILARRSLSPAQVKELLRVTANEAFLPTLDLTQICDVAESEPHWNCLFGAGLIDVQAAIDLPLDGDVAFPSCDREPEAPGLPCGLRDSDPYANELDIWTEPEVTIAGQPATIHVRVENRGTKRVASLVSVRVMPFGMDLDPAARVGLDTADVVGSRRVELGPRTSSIVSIPLPAQAAGHHGIRASVTTAADGASWNDVTQRSFAVLPPGPLPPVDFEIGNRGSKRATYRLRMRASRNDWTCVGEPTELDVRPEDPPARVTIRMSAPENRGPDTAATCTVRVQDVRTGQLAGGVVIAALPERACLVELRIAGRSEAVVPGQLVTAWRRGIEARAMADASGRCSLKLIDGASYFVEVPGLDAPGARRIIRARCGELLTLRPSGTRAPPQR